MNISITYTMHTCCMNICIIYYEYVVYILHLLNM